MFLRDDYKKYIQSHKDYIVVVYISATWCKPCKRASPYIQQYVEYLSKIHNNRFKFIKLDYDEHNDIIKMLRVKSIPMLLSYNDGLADQVCISSSPNDIDGFFKKITSSLQQLDEQN
jgi:thioredoxin-like negative regulator of GroEL